MVPKAGSEGRMNLMKTTAADGGQHHVGGRPGQGHQHALVSGAPEPRRVDRDRLGPPEDAGRGDDHHRRHDERSHGIDVHQRVEAEPTRPGGRVIAEESGHPAVRDLVEDDRRDHHQEEDDLLPGDVVVGHQGDEQHRAPTIHRVRLVF